MKSPLSTEILASFVCNLEAQHLGRLTRETVGKCLVDLAGAAIAGYFSLSARALRDTVMEIFATQDGQIWFSGHKRGAAGAAMANAAAASALDLDDGHRLAAGHPGAAVIPAALASCGDESIAGDRLLTAIVAGYEVAVRVSASRNLAAQDTLATGRWAAYGAAAARGKMRNLPPDLLAQALAIAGVLSPGLAAAGYSKVMGNHVKEGIPWAVFTGILAVALAERSYTGPVDILDHPQYHHAEILRANLGETWAIDNIYFKPYGCCRWIHSALEALAAILGELSPDPEDIHSIRVDTFGRALQLSNETAPATVEAAQYSIPYCLALLALKGTAALLPLQESHLRDPRVSALACRVSLETDPRFDGLFPQKTAARVMVRTGRSCHDHTVTDPRGDPTNAMTPDALKQKFLILSRDHLTREEQNKLTRLLEVQDRQHLESFVRALNRVRLTGNA
jgi:2-methylcitrate dehydratase PrpD